jgi:hypothetical protein
LSDEDNMPRARPQFVHLSEAEVWKAIAEDAGGAVEAEVNLRPRHRSLLQNVIGIA